MLRVILEYIETIGLIIWWSIKTFLPILVLVGICILISLVVGRWFVPVGVGLIIGLMYWIQRKF